MQVERLRLHFSESKENGVTVKVHSVCQKTITNEIKRKGDPVPTTSKKNRRLARSDVTKFSSKTHCFYYVSPCVPNLKR